MRPTHVEIRQGTMGEEALGSSGLDKLEALCCISRVETKVVESPGVDRFAATHDGNPRKTVGRRRPGSTLNIQHDTKANARAWRRAFPTPFVPKGVYRFNSHEEADAWLWKMIARKPSP